MSVQSEIERLNAAKTSLAAAIEGRGVEVPDEAGLDDYAALVDKIKAGGDNVLSPQEVYATQRPAEWVPLPTPGENEMVFLYLIPSTGTSTIQIAPYLYDASNTAQMTILLGNMVGDTFVQVDSIVYPSASSGGITSISLSPDDFSSVTSDGQKQAVIWVKVDAPCTGINLFPRTSRATLNVVDIRLNLPYIKQTLDFTGYGSADSAMQKLQFISIEGERKASTPFNLGQGFMHCTGLKAILSLPENIGNLYRAFYNCTSLIAIPELQCSASAVLDFLEACRFCYRLQSFSASQVTKVSSLSYSFHDCRSIRFIRNLDTSQVAIFNGAFWNCFCLEEIPELDTSRATTMYGMCYGARALKKLTTLDMTNVTNVSYITGGTQCLQKVLFDPTNMWTAPLSITMQNMSLPVEAIVDMLSSLPAISSAQTLNISGNAWNSMLTDADKAIATQKGWTLSV